MPIIEPPPAIMRCIQIHLPHHDSQAQRRPRARTRKIDQTGIDEQPNQSQQGNHDRRRRPQESLRMVSMSHRQRPDARFEIILQVLEAIRAFVHDAPGPRGRKQTPDSRRLAGGMCRVPSSGVDAEEAAADEDADGDGEADDGRGVVRHALAVRVEHVEEYVSHRVLQMAFRVWQRGHGGGPDGEERGGEDEAGAQGEGAAGERTETAALDLAVVFDIQAVVPANCGVAGHEGGEEKVDIEDEELHWLGALCG